MIQVAAQGSQSASSMFQEFVQGSAAPISIFSLVLTLVIGLLLSLLLQWHFRRYGGTLSNREQFAGVFPFLVLTTLLIITIVKSSLALSLGLVGALSIVRFRTPIKEPEELAYLFIAIAIGLGLGASQIEATVVATLIILAMLAWLRRTQKHPKTKNLYLSIEWPDGTSSPQSKLEALNTTLSSHTTSSDLRRFDVHEEMVEATYFVDLTDPHQLAKLVSELRRQHPTIGITFIDQNQLPTL